MQYYKETIEQINQLIKEKKYEQAFKIVSTELSMPYIPSEYEAIFQKLEREIISFLPNKNIEDLKTNFDSETIFRILQVPNHPYLIQAIVQMKDINLSNFCSQIEIIMKNPGILKPIKIIIFEYLSEQKVNHNFVIVTQEKTKKINPIVDSLDQNLDYLKTAERINNFTYNNPSLQEVCHNYFQQFLISIFPDKYIYEEEDEKVIVFISMKALNLKDLPELSKNAQTKLAYVVNILKTNL